MNTRSILALALLALSCSSPSSQEPIRDAAQPLTGSVTFFAVKDTEVREQVPKDAINYGGASLAGCNSKPGAQRRMLVAFGPLSGVPVGATITSASMSIALASIQGASGAGNVHALAALRPWTEGTVTWANWQMATNATSSTVYASTDFVAAQPYMIFDVQALAQGWLDGTNDAASGLLLDPANGVEIVNADPTPTGSNANPYTREDTTVAHRPQLAITWSLTAPASTCSDGIINQGESAADCGGPNCPSCAIGLGCFTNSDCAAATCSGGICVGAPDPDAGADGGACASAPAGPSVTPASTCTLITPAAVAPIDLAYGSDPAQMLSVYPSQIACPPAGCPAVIDVHGGGGTSDGGGRKSATLDWHMRVLASQGYVGITADYRLVSAGVNYWPAHPNDGRCILRKAHAIASTYNIDPAKIAVVGFSYGAQVIGLGAMTAGYQIAPHGTVFDGDGTCSVTWTATNGTASAVALFYGNNDLSAPPTASEWSAYTNQYTIFNILPGTALPAVALDAKIAPLCGGPPLYTTEGTADTTVAPHQSTDLCAAALAAGQPCTNVSIVGGVHGNGPTTGGAYLPASCTLADFLTAYR